MYQKENQTRDQSLSLEIGVVWLTKNPSTSQVSSTFSGKTEMLWKINSRRAWEIVPNFTKGFSFFVMEIYSIDSYSLQITN